MFGACTWLAYMSQGCVYLVTETCVDGKKSRVKSALEEKESCAVVVDVRANMNLEEIDGRVLCHDGYEDWEKLVESCLQIASVRESLTKRNHDETEGFGR